MATSAILVANEDELAIEGSAGRRRRGADYLVGQTDQELDKATQKRILEISKFSEEEKQHVWAVIDAFIAKAKIQSFNQAIL